MRESTIEQHAVAMFKAQGDLPYKFTSPGRRNVPDRLRLREIPPAHQAIVAHYVQFIEFKATGEKPTAAQEREHARLRKLGYRVEVIDSMAGVDALVSGPAPAAPGVSTVEDEQATVPADVMAALDRMCTPLDTSVLKGATAEADAFCMQLIRDYILRRPAPAAGDALDAARWRFVRRKLCLTGNGDGTCAMQAINLPASIPGWPEPGSAVAEFCDAAIDVAIAAQRKGES